MFIASNLSEYTVLDTGGGEKLEDVGGIILQRPDPQVIWEKSRPALWKPHAVYDRSESGGGSWRFIKKVPDKWTLSYGQLKFYIRPTGFKHIGLFPEQSANWDFISQNIQKSGRRVRMLNLFAYTGGATLAALHAGAGVVHVDAAKSMNEWAKENAALSGLGGADVRYIADDCHKFVLREQRRGSRYDAIVMDPPSYGRSGSKVWKIEADLFPLISDCAKLLSEDPLFFIVNSYTTGLSDVVTRNMLVQCVARDKGGAVESGTLVLPQKDSGVLLPCGTTARWYK
ncbi:MAG: class I SAM-dependent methyltransferase [Eubacteriales bacterium]|nr:class I SAM-dependent methyltransferase [Eubacteriales bacterium]